MKYVYLILFVFISICPMVRSEEVYLDLNPLEIQKFETGDLEYGDKPAPKDEDDFKDYLKPSFDTLKRIFDEDLRDKGLKSSNYLY